jgi:DNA-binding NarL/FixJ family response regulator
VGLAAHAQVFCATNVEGWWVCLRERVAALLALPGTWEKGVARMSADTPLCVVIADDDAYARRVTKHAIQAAGMTVVAEAEDGREAVELALHHRPDVVVVDAVLPRLDGILATRRILEADPAQLVVVLTGAGEGKLKAEALRAGAVDVVPKHADIGVLARALETAWGEDVPISRAAR